MDYRNRKYYLVCAPCKDIDNIVLFTKETIKSSKVHHLESINIPEWSSKLLISCKSTDSEFMVGLLNSFMWMVYRRRKYHTINKNHKNSKCIILQFTNSQEKVYERETLRFIELTKENLGQ